MVAGAGSQIADVAGLRDQCPRGIDPPALLRVRRPIAKPVSHACREALPFF